MKFHQDYGNTEFFSLSSKYFGYLHWKWSAYNWSHLWVVLATPVNRIKTLPSELHSLFVPLGKSLLLVVALLLLLGISRACDRQAHTTIWPLGLHLWLWLALMSNSSEENHMSKNGLLRWISRILKWYVKARLENSLKAFE